MTVQTPCPDSQHLEGLLRDSLPRDEQATLTEHVGACAACQIFGAFFKSKFLFQSLPRRGFLRAAPSALTGGASRFSGSSHSTTGRYRWPCRTASEPSSRASTRTSALRSPGVIAERSI